MKVDRETLLLSALFRCTPKESADFWASNLTHDFFTRRDKEFLWLIDFREKYGKMPDKGTFKTQFPDFTFVTTTEPLRYYTDKVIDQRRWEFAAETSNKVREVLERRKLSSLGEVYKLFENALTNAPNRGDIGRSSLLEMLDPKNKSLAPEKGKFPTPWPTMTEALYGTTVGNLIVMTARWNVGKTMVLCAWNYYLAMKGVRTLFVSLEMTKEQIAERIAAIGSRVSFSRLVKDKLGPKQTEKLAKWTEMLKAKQIDIPIVEMNTIAGATPTALLGLIDEYTPEVVFVDGAAEYLNGGKDLVQGGVLVARALKRIPLVRKLLLIGTCQQNRGAEDDDDGSSKPGAGKFAWNDQLPQVADTVIALAGKRGDITRNMYGMKGRQVELFNITLNWQMHPVTDIAEMAPDYAGVGAD